MYNQIYSKLIIRVILPTLYVSEIIYDSQHICRLWQRFSNKLNYSPRYSPSPELGFFQLNYHRVRVIRMEKKYKANITRITNKIIS